MIRRLASLFFKRRGRNYPTVSLLSSSVAQPTRRSRLVGSSYQSYWMNLIACIAVRCVRALMACTISDWHAYMRASMTERQYLYSNRTYVVIGPEVLDSQMPTMSRLISFVGNKQPETLRAHTHDVSDAGTRCCA